MGRCALGTPNIRERQYPILQTSHVQHTGDTSSTSTTGLTLRFLLVTISTLSMGSVNWKCMVSDLKRPNGLELVFYALLSV